MTSLVAQMVKRLPTMRKTWVQSLGREDPLEKEMATHSSTLATSCEELTHWKRLGCWEGLGAGGEGDDKNLQQLGIEGKSLNKIRAIYDKSTHQDILPDMSG